MKNKTYIVALLPCRLLACRVAQAILPRGRFHKIHGLQRVSWLPLVALIGLLGACRSSPPPLEADTSNRPALTSAADEIPTQSSDQPSGRWLTETQPKPWIRLRGIDSNRAIYLLAKTLGREVIIAHGHAHPRISGDWNRSDNSQPIDAIAAAAGMGVRQVQPSPQNSPTSVVAPMDLLGSFKPSASLFTAKNAPSPMTVALFRASLADIIELTTKLSDVRAKPEHLNGQISIYLKTRSPIWLLNTLVELVDASTKRPGATTIISDVNMPAVSKPKIPTCFHRKPDGNVSSLMSVPVDALELTGVIGTDPAHAILGPKSENGCLLERGDVLETAKDGSRRRWIVSAITNRDVQLQSPDDAQGPGRVRIAFDAAKPNEPE